MEALESSTVSERGVETTQQDAKVKLEETCILVDGDELHFVPHKEGKRRPYKVLSLDICVCVCMCVIASNCTFFFFRKRFRKPFLQE